VEAEIPEPAPGLLLGAIFSGSPDAVVVVNDAGEIVLSSPAVIDLFGYYPEELVGTSLDILIPARSRPRHGDHLRHFFEAPRSRTMGEGLQLDGRHRNGEEFAVEVSLTPVDIQGRRYAAAFVRDGRERQRGIDRLHAINEITQRLLAGAELPEVLRLIAQRARQLSRSDAVWIVRPTSADELEVTAVDGPATDVLLGVVLSAETSRSADVMRTGTSQVIDDLSTASNVPGEVIELGLGPGLYVPLTADESRLGALVLGRMRGAPAFAPLDVAFAEVFASSTAAAIELGDVRAEVERLGIVTEDERIARDLHDTVIQHLFAIGMSLQAGRRTTSGAIAERIDNAVTDLDNVIHDIRNTIFRLPGRMDDGSGLRDEMMRVADRYTEELGFRPRFAFHGAVDAAVPATLRAHVIPVLAEALSNVARHAGATSVEAVVSVDGRWLTLSLVDDGVGVVDEPTAGQGLRNMAARAMSLGGTCTVSRRDTGGTIVEWRVPV
jgi:PAS domain S-box-containing protein